MTDNLNGRAEDSHTQDGVVGAVPTPTPKISHLNHAAVRGKLDPVVLQQCFTLVVGAKRHAKSWSNVTSAGKEVLNLF